MNYKNAKQNENGTIDCDIEHPVYGWIPATLSPDDEETAELYEEVSTSGSAAEFTPYIPTAEQQKVLDRQAALQTYNSTITAMIGTVPQTEIDSWPKQEAEARDFVVNGDSAVTPLLDGLISARGLGETKAVLANLIIVNADTYAVGFAQALGTYQAAIKALA